MTRPVHIVACPNIANDVGKHLASILSIAMAPTEFVDVGTEGAFRNSDHGFQFSFAVSPKVFDVICAGE